MTNFPHKCQGKKTVKLGDAATTEVKCQVEIENEDHKLIHFVHRMETLNDDGTTVIFQWSDDQA